MLSVMMTVMVYGIEDYAQEKATVLLVFFYMIMTGGLLNHQDMKNIDDVFYFTIFCSSLIATLPILPEKPLRKRLAIIIMGVASIFGLSEVSKLLEHFSTSRRQ
jgi:hypothetical protein